jgi:hypothetical protein
MLSILWDSRQWKSSYLLQREVNDSSSVLRRLKDGHRGRLSKVRFSSRELTVPFQTGHDGRFAARSRMTEVRKTVSADCKELLDDNFRRREFFVWGLIGLWIGKHGFNAAREILFQF